MFFYDLLSKKQGLQKAFTLIELLVIIVILGVISLFIINNFAGASERARDAQRKSDLRQIQNALELKRLDTGSYLLPGTAGLLAIGNCDAQFQVEGQLYMEKIPCDPLGVKSGFNSGRYFYLISAPTYKLTACLENVNDRGKGVVGTHPIPVLIFMTGSCPSGKYYTVSGPD